ncbi:MAG: type II toxin-antitoxin system VapC family toxin [Pseudomonadota bacterium]
MAALLDTHALIWWVLDSPRLSRPAYDAIADPANEVFVSAACAWEVTTKNRLGKLPEAQALAVDFAQAIGREGFLPLDISIAHAERAGRLPGPHKDPFDRMLIAQALVDDLELISIETAFDAYGVRRLW